MIIAASDAVTLTRFEDGHVTVEPGPTDKISKLLSKTLTWPVGTTADDGTITRADVDVEPGDARHFRAVCLKLGARILVDDGEGLT
jgi:hypothetical protein